MATIQQSKDIGNHSRLPPRHREDLRPDQQAFHDYFHETVSKNAPHPGASERAGNTLFPTLAVLPKTGRTQVDMLALLEEEAVGLPPDARETASLVATSHFKSAYVTHIHKMMAIKQKSLTESQAETLAKGGKPSNLNDDCSLAYDIAHHLLEVRGPLPQDLWDKGNSAFGLEGTIGLVHYVSLLAWTSMGMNAADVPAPEPPK
ncbi:hypothetical protein B0A55_08825 [Friedmanniomyces simplex]|uniref:Uncharacterized protein n=1 Tax=Friedmanniomyces simplex TaxID=329884 RepID=A0A4U0X3L9_9PEZI|nr:hypothetical protein B0A55_08825 [Friedmanniomyces simplex]